MKYHIWTEGCQMNVADSKRLAFILNKLDFTYTKSINDSDLIILNTCVVRQSAEDKAIGRISSLKRMKENNPDVIINVMGCLVGINENPELQKKFSWVDVFSPPSDYSKLLSYLRKFYGKSITKNWRMELDKALDENFPTPGINQALTVSEFIPIVLGCSHACAYCVIPSKRGKEQSRPFEDIIQEATCFVSKGVREITLLGQIVDRYGFDLPNSVTLSDLILSLSEIKDLMRIRFLTSHPNWMSDDLIEIIANNPKVMPHIELPIQSGDNEILRAMRRGYTVEKYLNIIDKIREKIPHVSIATDIIVGFPGETHEKYINTRHLLKKTHFDMVHLARYSPRENTYSAKYLEDDVPDTEKMFRFRELETLQEEIIGNINKEYLGKVVPVLIEGKSKTRWRGRTDTNKLVFVDSDKDLSNKLVNVRITWTGPWSMIASEG